MAVITFAIMMLATIANQWTMAQTPPAGKLVYHRYTDYEKGDSEMFVVSYPSGEISEELGARYKICNPMNGIWSPDGLWLAVMGQAKSGNKRCTETDRSKFDVYLLDMTTPGSVTRVTDNEVPDEDPQFFPSGSHLIFKHNDHIALWKVGSPPFTTCDDLTGGSFCFKSTGEEQSKPVVTPDEKRICYWEGARNNADVYCFDLALALKGQDIDSIRIPVATNPGIEDYFPVIDKKNIYYARWRSPDNNANVVERKQLSNLAGNPQRAKFCTNIRRDYSDPCGLGNNLVIFSSTDTEAGDYDLFLAKFFSSKKRSLDEFTAGFNSRKNELGANFFPK